jgi:alpha-L-rhamnosidase
MRHAAFTLLVSLFVGTGFAHSEAIQVGDLRCEYLEDPMGVDAARPRLSWVIQSQQRGQRQTAYQLLVAASPAALEYDRGDLWDSGKVASDETAHVIYAGPPLGSRQVCCWKVRAWDRDGQPSGWSKVARWEMGLLRPGDWSAQWIEADRKKIASGPATGPVPILRKSFALGGKPVASARLYATALGLYEIRINGQRVGDHVLAPDWTDYRKRVRYQVYDVASLLKPGGNAMAALLGNGWYCGHIGNGGFQFFGKVPALLAQLEVTHSDGSVERIVSDASWKIHASPILASDFMLGESYDATKEVPGWDSPGLDDMSWTAATVRQEPARLLEGQVMQPVRQTGELKPKSVSQPKPGQWTFDLGQNMVGVVRLKVSAPAGTKLTLRHAEMLNPDGALYTANLRGAASADTYVCKGGGAEVWQPTFTFHGFRYVELTGLPRKPDAGAVTGIVLGSDTPRTGEFTCSDPRINQLQSNIWWGQRGNYLSIPTDCPQRDERLGWMGDAQVFIRTATMNADVAAFFTKWLVDVDDGQSPEGAFSDVSPNTGGGGRVPAWADAGVICPWTIYQVYGDRRVLERHLPAMTRWIEWCRKHSTSLIRDKDRGGDYGDWLAIGANTPRDLIGTAYFAYSTGLVARSYRVIGNEEEAAKYEKLRREIKAAFNKRYVKPDGRITGNTQCCYAMALKFDLLPEELRAKAAQYLEEDIKAKGWHLSTGFVGVSYLLPVLTQAGKVETAYRLLMQDTFPSWLFSVKHGATTIWERWDGWTPERGFQNPGMNSFNHYSLGSCGQWLFDSAAGIGLDPEKPGFRHIIIHPRVGGGLTSASASLRSLRGLIASSWSLKDGTCTLDVTLPANTTATVYVPAANAAAVQESGQPAAGRFAAPAEGVKWLRAEGPEAVFEVQSGVYRFTAR